MSETKPTVLVVEDDEALCAEYETLMKSLGIQTMCVHAGMDGILRARSETFAAFIVDIQLPDVDGWQVVRTIREKCPRAPILVISARHPDRVEQEIRDQRLSGILVILKSSPEFGEQICSAIRSILLHGGSDTTAD